MNKHLYFGLTLLFLLTGCSEDLSVRNDINVSYGKGKFTLNETLHTYFYIDSYLIHNEGLRYYIGKDVSENAVSGPWNKEANIHFEHFVSDFNTTDAGLGKTLSIQSLTKKYNTELSKEEYQINLDSDYWWYYTGSVNDTSFEKSTFVDNHDIAHYRNYIYFSAFCYVPSTQKFYLINASRFYWDTDLPDYATEQLNTGSDHISYNPS